MVYDINMKKIKARYTFGISLVILGIILFIIIGSLSFPALIKSVSLKEEIVAEKMIWNIKRINVINLEFYSADYIYKVNDKVYTCESYYLGDTKIADPLVFYDVNNPNNCITSFDKDISIIVVLLLIVPTSLVLVGIFIILKKMRKNHLLKHLATYGTLIKRVPYEIYSTNKKVDGQVIKYLIVKYTFKNKVTKLFKSDFFVNDKVDTYGLCDLLVDEKNLDNFIIDFEIKTTGKGEPNIIHYEQIYSDYRKINY
ncbi:MAG: hypothetical protein IJN90_01155 [Bacilli bacterium]|nr:hypothetical protein [Bacilli bacterium]